MIIGNVFSHLQVYINTYRNCVQVSFSCRIKASTAITSPFMTGVCITVQDSGTCVDALSHQSGDITRDLKNRKNKLRTFFLCTIRVDVVYLVYFLKALIYFILGFMYWKRYLNKSCSLCFENVTILIVLNTLVTILPEAILLVLVLGHYGIVKSYLVYLLIVLARLSGSRYPISVIFMTRQGMEPGISRHQDQCSKQMDAGIVV